MKDLFKKYEKMVMKAAWAITKKYQMDHNSVKDQANTVLHDAYMSWDKDKASFSTHLHIQLKTLHQWASLESRYSSLEEYEPGYYSQYNPQEILESSYSLSEDAQLIFKLLTTGAIDSIGDHEERFREVSKNRILKYCSSILSWEVPRVKKTLEEMQTWYDSEIAYSF